MAYYITKDCGFGWDETTKGELRDWGVSGSQETLAKKLKQDDVLLHYIDHVQAWSGYSKLAGALISNTREKDQHWRTALPWILPLTPVKYLSKPQCQLTRPPLPGVSDRHQQRAFSKVPDEEALVIINKIECVAKIPVETEDQTFSTLWEQGADGYYGNIRKAMAYYKCEACGEYGKKWANERHGGRLRKGDEDEGDWFLEAAHIKPRHKGGPATPDNLRALCRNCHHLIDRLSEEERCGYLRTGLPFMAAR